MSLYTDYLTEIETRKEQGLNPKPIDDGALKDLIGACNKSLADARAQAQKRLASSEESLTLDQLVAVEPPFVVVLRTLISFINAGDLAISSLAE